ncbi:MAG TPA: DUF1360 domain-containing protein [Terracidiphilus sp.]|nr:DUF1360 domain-containing protein [Terracidiphilus sp.]
MAVLAVWRLTHLLAAEDGPADLVVRLRKLLGDSFVGRMMDCFYCLSVWIAAPAALFVTPSGRIFVPGQALITRLILDWFMNWLAISGAACLLERLTTRRAALQAMHPPEQPPQETSPQGESENVLRFETYADQEHPGLDANSVRHSAHLNKR